MNLLHEWPLVIFTLASQVAVGSFLALLVVWGMVWREGRDSSPSAPELGAVAGWSRRPLLFVGIMTVVGLAASFLHLGAPLNALRALSNVGHSWLSREILAALAFLGFWILTFLIHGRTVEVPRWLRRSPVFALALAGILLIWTMTRVYMLPARPVWDTWLTPASFFLAAVLLGTVALAAHLGRHPLPFPRLGTRSPAPRSAAQPSPSMAAPDSPLPFPARFSPGVVLLSMALAAALAQLSVASFHPVTESLRTAGSGATLASARILLLLAGALVITSALVRTALEASGNLRASRASGASGASGASVASGASGASVPPEGFGDLGALRTSGASETTGASGFAAAPGPEGPSGFWTAIALLLLLASETLGRMLFYAVGTADPF